MVTTLENPLNFFVYALTKKYIDDTINETLNNLDLSSFDGVTIKYKEQDYHGVYKEYSLALHDMVVPKLFNNFNKCKQYLYRNCIAKDEKTTTNYLKIQFRIIQKAICDNAQHISKYQFLLLPIRGIVKYLNEVLLVDGMEEFVLNDDCISDSFYDVVDSQNNQTDEELFDEIFGFMKGNNEKRDTILSLEDYETMINYIKSLVINEEVPSVGTKLSPDVSNDLLSFSFWVLHKKLFTTKKIKPVFLIFLKEVFVNFENFEFSSLKSSFGSKTRVKKDTFLPEVIQNLL